MYEKEFEYAKMAVLEAGESLKKKIDIHIDSMDGRDIKLSSDKNSEKILIDELSQFGYSILSEEQGFQNKDTRLKWVIDPLDGTMNFLRGMDELACISVALFDGNKPILGVVNRFMMGELFTGLIDRGAFLNNDRIKPSETKDLNQAVLATGFPVKRSYETASLTTFISDVQKFKKIRMFGTAAIMGTFVACGRIDAYMEEDIMIWDIAGAAAIVDAAGGCLEIKKSKDNKCLCRLFANEQLFMGYKNESF